MSKLVDVLIDAYSDAHNDATARAIAALTPPPVRIQPANPAAFMCMILDRYIRELAVDVPDPLAQQLTVGAVLFDLLTLAEAPVPAAVLELIGAPTH